MEATVEFWVEQEILSISGTNEENDTIVEKLFDEFLPTISNVAVSWHFFREPAIRFRVQARSIEERDRISVSLDTFLDSLGIVSHHFPTCHGNAINNLDEGYKGEAQAYKRMWHHQERLWQLGSEMAVEAIREFREKHTNDPSREHQLSRAYHLLCNQMRPLDMTERQLYIFCARGRQGDR
jgi:hypothetical protein